MKCSHNELASLIKKAAMGKGFPEGIAKEIAFAALSLPKKQAEAAHSGLIAHEGWSVAKNGPAFYDRALMDLLSGETTEFKQTLDNVDSLELLEGMALAAAHNYGMISNIETHSGTTEVSIRLSEVTPPRTISGAINVPSEIYNALNVLAQKTYVPATDASRLMGAGAGLTDND